MDGEILHDRTGREPSVEYLMHLVMYRSHPDTRVVIHSHPPYATAYSLLKDPPKIPALTYELTLLVPEIIITPYRPSGSEELAMVVSDALSACGTAILESHGVVAVAETFRKAAIMTRALEEYLQLYLRAKQFGGEIREFRKAQVATDARIAVKRFAEQVTEKTPNYAWDGNTLKSAD